MGLREVLMGIQNGPRGAPQAAIYLLIAATYTPFIARLKSPPSVSCLRFGAWQSLAWC
jgi:hypothetical protein